MDIDMLAAWRDYTNDPDALHPCEHFKAGWTHCKKSFRINECREALAELVDLKCHKDEHGKTAEYQERQPKAWEKARALIEPDTKETVKQVERTCYNCKYCGMDMDMDPYCAHPKVLERMPFGQNLTSPVPECPTDNHPLFEHRNKT